MSTTTAPTASLPAAGVRHAGDRSLAVALGVARPAPAVVRVPPVARHLVAGQSPLEAYGWAAADAPRVPSAR